jgi:phage gp36-like protein
MSYAVQADLEKLTSPAALVQLADDDNNGVADAGVVSEALAWADDQINAYCGLRFQVPFATVPGVINKIAIDLALYHIYTRRSTQDVPAVRAERYKDAIAFLTKVSRGEVTLGVQPAPPEDRASQDDAAQSHAASDRVFTIRKPAEGTPGTLDHF